MGSWHKVVLPVAAPTNKGAARRLKELKRSEAQERAAGVQWEHTRAYRRIRDAFAEDNPSCTAPGFCGTIGDCACLAKVFSCDYLQVEEIVNLVA